VTQPSSFSGEKRSPEPFGLTDGSGLLFSGKKILLIANTAWNLWNFRRALLEHLSAQGAALVCAAPEDGFQWHLQGAVGGWPLAVGRQPTTTRFVPLRRLSRKSIFSLNNALLFWELVRLLRREKPDLALFFTIKPNILGVLAAQLTGTRAISTIEGRGISATSKRWLRAVSALLYRAALRFAHRVIFINPDDRADFLRYRIVRPEQTVLVNGPGVDVQHFAPRPKLGRDFIFLFPARLLAEKGVREFAAAAALLKKRGLNARFQILGNTDSGNPTSISKQELELWVAEGYIEYLGFTDDVRPHMAEADAVALPSYYREGVPRCLLEAMSMEKPILTADSVGCRETVDEGLNGFLVAPRDVGALAEAMQKMAALPPEKLREMGRRGRQKALAQFSDEVVLPQLLAVIGAALGRPSESRAEAHERR
jgi:glycosyltransferase involved in cell wall biosynthesis